MGSVDGWPDGASRAAISARVMLGDANNQVSFIPEEIREHKFAEMLV